MDRKRTGESLKDMFKREKEGSKESKPQDAKALKRQNSKRKHTIYLSPEQSKKLRIYAAQNDMQLSEVVEKVIDKNL